MQKKTGIPSPKQNSSIFRSGKNLNRTNEFEGVRVQYVAVATFNTIMSPPSLSVHVFTFLTEDFT